MRPIGRKMLISLSAVAALVSLGLYLVSSDITAEDEALARRIHATRGTTISFSQIYPEKWDHVCWLGDYSRPSSWIPRLLPQSPSRLKFVPHDRWVDEGRRALMFIDSTAAEVRVFLLDYRDLDPPEEPDCVERDRATFRIETINASNLTYTKLVISNTPVP